MSKKDRQCTGQTKWNKRTNNDHLQNAKAENNKMINRNPIKDRG